MCGIAGIAGAQVDRGALLDMGRALAHRGPDDEGTYQAADIGFAFRRLSILDLSGGRQPMGNQDGGIQVVFNGEIYNHQDLRRQLASLGHRFFTSHSDTEAIVHGWEEWGASLFPRLNGMFAIAIWDARARTLVLARDRHGIKPLYFAPLAGGGIAFASEIRAIHASGMIPALPCREGILEYLSFQNLWGERTMFRGVHMLEAGSTLSWRAGSMQRSRYWDMKFPRRRTGTLPALAEEHRQILKAAVRRQLAADVPVMAYLSGGIDSTSLTVVSHQIDPGVTAYSCVFDLAGVGDDRFVDERAYSRSVASAYGLRRIEHEIASDSLARVAVDYAKALEDLRMGMGYPVYLIAQRVARDAKVVLSGTGGDELHAGYVGRYASLGLSSAAAAGGNDKSRAIEAAYRSMLNFVLKPAQRADALTKEFLSGCEFDVDAAIDAELRSCPSDDWRDRVMYVDARTYLHGLLVLEDKLSMAHSLETRVPLLDNELVDFVLDVPFEHLCRGDTGKILFRESVRPWVPQEIYGKPKMGFGPPDASWYRGALRGWIETALSPSRCEARAVFRPEFVARALAQHFSGRANHAYLIWSLLSFDAWCEAFGFFGGALEETASGSGKLGRADA